MSTSERERRIVAFSSLVEGLYFAQVHNEIGTRVVHETGLYSSKSWAKQAAHEWVRDSQSAPAKSLEMRHR